MAYGLSMSKMSQVMKDLWVDPDFRARQSQAMRGVSHGTSRSLADRFWEKVDKSGMFHPVFGQCWEWYGSSNAKGYGQLSDGVRLRKAHHVSWYLHTGTWPGHRKQVCHHCDNTACVRPEHLFIGTPKQNTEDMVRKGRAAGPRGERSATAVLTWEKVREIRAIPQTYGSEKMIMELYGISRSTLGALRRGDTWKE